nr:putative E3 ubiquitin-protein ligase LIN-1 isoform X1 [Arachis hypogaea]
MASSSSLRDLLKQEGFHHHTKPKPTIPFYLCHDNNKTVTMQKERLLGSQASNSMASRTAGPPMDAVAIRAVIAILSGYIGRYVKDDFFRKTIRDKCSSYLATRRNNGGGGGDEILVTMEIGIESIDQLVQDREETRSQMKIKSLRNSIKLLTIVASLNSTTSRNAETCGIPNSHLSACAQLYMSIVYKLQKNDRICARHLLQVFCDSPFLARNYLLPELWEHLFLPHLLHLKIWYAEELDRLSFWKDFRGEKEKRIKALSRLYVNKLDTGTALFALYYKQWLKVGADEPPLPIVSLPSTITYGSSRKNSTDSFASHSSIRPNLYKEVFGPKLERNSVTLDERNGVSTVTWGSGFGTDEHKCSSFKKGDMLYIGRPSRRINEELRSESQRLDYFRSLSCRNIRAESFVHSNYGSKNSSFGEEEETTTFLSSEFVGAVTTLCSSDTLSECEFAIRVITRAWLKSHGNPLIEKALRQYRVVEAIMEVLFASSKDEILEFSISVLADLAARNNAITTIMLNSDPQLEIFMRLLRSTSLFLKAAVLLYLSKPQAKQMLSPEWVPLVLRVLEFGEKAITLFAVQCNPQVAAMYLLEKLLTGFHQDKNLENARAVVSLGGLTLLMRRIEDGEFNERNKAASMIHHCIRAEGSCRSFLAENINKTSLLELIVLGNSKNSSGFAFSVLPELLYLDRTCKILSFLRGIKDAWGGLSTMHILFIFLKKAPIKEHPLVAIILLLLDLLEDPFKESFYRAEAMEAVMATLNCETCNDTIQEQSAKALLLLACHFSHDGESLIEKSLLQEAGFQQHCLGDSHSAKEIVVYDLDHKDEEIEEGESWRKRVAIGLFKSGNKNLILALANCVANGIPCLARASLVTISWMSRYLHLVEDRKLQEMALSIFTPKLIISLSFDKDAEERVLASYSLLCLVKNSAGCGKVLPSLLANANKASLGYLQNLSLVTCTANELISIISKSNENIHVVHE